MKISVVINVVSEEIRFLERALVSLTGFAAEIVVVDMTQGDKELEKICEKYEVKKYPHKKYPFVEKARNYGISKAHHDWVFIMDPDEEIPKSLAKKLTEIALDDLADYVRIPRKNIIFGKYIQHTRYWPDYLIRFFKKGAVTWSSEIHSVPTTRGRPLDLSSDEKYALIHHNYQTLSQFLVRMDRYTDIQAEEIMAKSKKFIWKDLLRAPLSEFLSRYFAGEGYKDGLHGLAISLLQSYSEMLVYLKVWEKEKFLEQAVSADEVSSEFGLMQSETNWWITDMLIKNKPTLLSLPFRIKRKLSKNG